MPRQHGVLEEYAEPDTRQAHLEPDPLDPLLAPWQRLKERSSEELGLDLLLAYTATAQLGTESDRGFTASQQIDFIGRWRVLESPRFGAGAVSFALAHIGTLGGVNASDFQESLGSSWLSNIFDTDPDSHVDEITFLTWDHWLFEDRLHLAVGKLDSTSIVAQNRYLADGQEAFLATPLAQDPVLPFFEISGLGALARATHDDLYASVSVIDATASRNGIDFDSVSDGKWQQSLEIGWTPRSGPGEGAYRLAALHVPRVGSGRDEASGWSFVASFDQDLGEAWALFLYFSRAHGRVLTLQQQLSAGAVFKQPFGRSHDDLGLGLTWGKPEKRGLRSQYGVELYLRLQLTDRIELTPDLQLLLSPADGGQDVEAVFGLRTRIFF